MTYTLSPSSISLMQNCRRCFWLDKHKMWSRPLWPFPSLPSGMDRVLKAHFDRFTARRELPPELKSRFKSAYRLFDNKALLEEWRDWRRGLRWQDKDGNVLMGAIDNVLIKGRKLVVLDYKTRGYPVKDDSAEHYQSQLDIYDFLMNKAGYPTERYGFLLFYVPKFVHENGAVHFETTLKRIPVDPAHAELLFKRAVRLLEGPCPRERCEWCNYVDGEVGGARASASGPWREASPQ